jgi:hypothetical protein
MTKHNARVKVWNPVDPEIERRSAAVATAILEVMPDELGEAHTWAIVEKAAARLREHYEKHA